MSFKLETRNLLLRDFSIDDLDGYVAFTQDEKYQRFYNEIDCSPEKSQQLVETFIEWSFESPRTKYQLAVTEKGKQEFIGTCGLRLESDGQASIGCGIARKHHTSGFAAEAMSALVSFGFDKLEVHRVYAETIEDNKPAVNLCKKFGMRVEGTFIEHRYFKGQWWNTVVLALLESEWAGKERST